MPINKIMIQPSLIRVLSIGEEHLIPLDNDKKEMLSVTLYDANHCPGSVMFLFQGYFGNIFYTGDFRFSPELMTSLKLPAIDTLYLDNTYCSPTCEFSTREDATEIFLHRLYDCLHTSKRIFLGLDNLGKEELLEKIYKATNSKICVSPARFETLELLGYSDLVTTDGTEAKVTVVLTNQITVANVSKWDAEVKTCAFLPTARYSGLAVKPYSRQSNVHIVPYSNHSSFKELQIFVKHVHPRHVVPIVGRHVKGIFGTDISERCNMNVFSNLLSGSPYRDFTIPASVQSSMILWLRENLHIKRKRQRQNRIVSQKKLKPVHAVKGVLFENNSQSCETVPIIPSNTDQLTKAKNKMWKITLITPKKKCKTWYTS